MRTLSLTLALLLTACGSGDSAPTGGADERANDTPSSPAETASAAGPASCLIGTWQLDPASMDFDNSPAMQEVPDAEFSVGETSGRALLAFEADGDAVQTFEDFSVTVNASVMGMTMSVRNDYSGTAAAEYRVEGDRLVMEPGEADLTATVSVNGGAARANPFATESIFESWERGRSSFACEGDDLTFDIRDPEDDTVFFHDVRYTRVGA